VLHKNRKTIHGENMNTFGAFDLFDSSTWFDSSSSINNIDGIEGGTGSSFGSSNDPFGWSSWFSGGQSTDIQAGVSDSQLNDWNTYWSSGGVMGNNLGSGTSTGTSSTDIFGGFNDFLSGITGLAQTGLGVWQGVQTIINQQNPSDELVKLPGSNTPVVKRTTGGKTEYFPITQLYPGLSTQVQTAQQNSWIAPVLIAGVLGVGLILILKKK
jgi:hypothetical protein